MTSLKARLLGGWVGDRFLRTTEITEVLDIGTKFRLVTLAGEGMRGAANAAGDKVQIFVGDDGTRTYTPFAFDADRGQFSLLAYLHGDEPGARWARSLVVGAKVRVLGPRDSLALASMTGPTALFGDETSFAVARSLLDLRRAASAAPPVLVLEVGSRAETEDAAKALALPLDALVERRADRDTFAAECAQRLTQSPAATIALTGNARSIQSVRAELRKNSGSFVQKVKPYWSPGKRGLD